VIRVFIWIEFLITAITAVATPFLKRVPYTSEAPTNTIFDSYD